MKSTFLLLPLFLLLNTSILSDNNFTNGLCIDIANHTHDKRINIHLQNNSLLPRKFILKVKAKNDDQFGVVSFKLLPYFTHEESYAEGTSIYLVNEEEQKSLMEGGQDIIGKLLLTIKAADEGKTVKLISEE